MKHKSVRKSVAAINAAFVLITLATLSNPSKGSAAPDANTFYMSLGTDPSTLNVITSSDAVASTVESFIYDSLATRDTNTYEWIPQLAESFSTSKDGLTFTFKLRKGLKWTDGQPLTSEDVKYSFDVYFDGRFEAPEKRVYFEGIKEVKIVDPETVQFIVKQPYFKNFDVAAGLTIIPKHFFSVGDPKDPKFNKVLIGTGPYILDSWERGQRILLKANPNYWGRTVPYFKDRNLHGRISMKVITEDAVSLEMVKKGDLDFTGLTAEQYVQKTKGPEWGTKVVAVKAENSSDDNLSYGFIAWNNVHPIFKDKNVRKAMSYLVNRDLMIEKFRFGLSEKASGPFGNKCACSSPNVKPITYDPKMAVEILTKAGWKMGPDGLSKDIDGKPTKLEFTLTNSSKDFEKYLTIIKEDMKKVGITLNIKFVEWNSFVKLLDERKFEAIGLAWTADLDPDPKQIWHSASIPSPGSNFVGYSNPEVDKLIDEARSIMDQKARYKIMHKVHELIADDAPYSFFFNAKFAFYAASKRINRPKDTLKYGIGVDTWSIIK